jgi:hypothetical protein
MIKMTREEFVIEHKTVWREVYIAAIRAGFNCQTPHSMANKAVEAFKSEFGPYEGVNDKNSLPNP